MKLNNLLFSIIIFSLFFNTILLSQEPRKASTLSKEEIMLILAKAQADRKKLLRSLLETSPQGLSLAPAESSAINVHVKNNPDNANNTLTQTTTQTNTESSSTQKTQKVAQTPTPGSLNIYERIALNTFYAGAYAGFIASFAVPGGSLYFPAVMVYNTIVPAILMVGCLNSFASSKS